MNLWWKLIAVSRCLGLGSANMTYQNKIDRQKLDPYVFWRTCVRHGKPGKVWNMVRVFLRPIFVYTILHGDSACGPWNARNEYEARRERAAARNRYRGDLRSFHFLMSPPKLDFEPISGAVYGVSGANPPSAPVYFFGYYRTINC